VSDSPGRRNSLAVTATKCRRKSQHGENLHTEERCTRNQDHRIQRKRGREDRKEHRTAGAPMPRITPRNSLPNGRLLPEQFGYQPRSLRNCLVVVWYQDVTRWSRVISFDLDLFQDGTEKGPPPCAGIASSSWSLHAEALERNGRRIQTRVFRRSMAVLLLFF